MRTLLALFLSTVLLLSNVGLLAQTSSGIARRIQFGPSLPATCSPATGDIFFVVSGGTGTPYYCDTVNHWATWTGGGGGGTAPVIVSLDTDGVAPGNCTVIGGSGSCTASPTTGTGSTPGVAITHNLGTQIVEAVCINAAGAWLGGITASTMAITDGVNGTVNLTTISFNGATVAKCGVATMSMGPKGDPGSTGSTGPAGTNGTNGTNGANPPPGCSFDGSGSTVTLNSICYYRATYACTLSTSYSIMAIGSSPTATIDVFKIAAGSALPTASIISSSTPALATGNAVIGTTAWTSTTVTLNDMFAFKVTAVANATWLDIALKCN